MSDSPESIPPGLQWKNVVTLRPAFYDCNMHVRGGCITEFYFAFLVYIFGTHKVVFILGGRWLPI